MNSELLDFIHSRPTPFQAVDNISKMLEKAGYIRLNEGGSWSLERGKGYFVTRNLSSVIAFRVPDEVRVDTADNVDPFFVFHTV